VPGPVVVDVAVGLVLVFLTSALLCSAAVEWVGNLLGKRGSYLLRGLRELLDIPPSAPSSKVPLSSVAGSGGTFLIDEGDRRRCLQDLSVAGVHLRDDLARAEQPLPSLPAPLADLVLAHPVIAGLHRPGRPGRTVDRHLGTVRVGTRAEKMHLASYVSARAFSRCLVDLLVPDGAGNTSLATLRRSVDKLPEGLPARDALLTFVRDAGDDVGAFREALERWYDEHMGRVSGWYKRWAQWRLFIAGAVLAVVVNLNSIHIGTALYEDQPLRDAVVAQSVSAQGCPQDGSGGSPEACLRQQTDLLRSLSVPLGWDRARAAADCRVYNGGEACWPHVENWVPFWLGELRHGPGRALLVLAGWLLTAVAVSFGAPFWFDALSKLGSLRTAGRRPGENRPYDAVEPARRS
jgi:hypothetical protein